MQNSSIDTDESTRANESAFMEMLRKREDPDLIAVASRIIKWAGDRGLALRWSIVRDAPVFVPTVQAHGQETYFVEVTARGRVDILFNRLMETEPFRDEEMRLEILRRLNRITGLSMPEFTISRRPNFSLSAIANDTAFAQFTSTFDWVMSQL